MTLLAAEEVRRFGVTPSVALLSHSSFGSSDAPSAQQDARRARADLRERARSSRSKARCAAMRRCRRRSATHEFPDSRLDGGRQPAHHAQRRRGEHHLQPAAHDRRRGITVGGILLGAAKPVHILTPSSTVRRIVNMTALAVADALERAAP